MATKDDAKTKKRKSVDKAQKKEEEPSSKEDVIREVGKVTLAKKKKLKSSEVVAINADKVIPTTEAQKPKKEKKEKKGTKSSSDVELALEAKKDTGEVGNGRDEAIKVSEKKTPENQIVVSGRGSDDPKLKPFQSFSETGLPPAVMKVFEGFAKPSPIQSHAWPVLMAGRDFIGIAKTGSGKTLAFGAPALSKILKSKLGKNGHSRGPFCLVVAPTRELAQQIAEVLEDLCSRDGLKTVCVFGGADKKGQRYELKKNPAVVVATPGRLLDFVEEGACDLSNASYVVLDEADRMLDLGFEPAIRAILSKTSKDRQTVMLSATWPSAVGQLASEFVKDPIKVTIGSVDLAANHDVTQIVEVIEDRARDKRLDDLLRQYHKTRKNRILVFVLYKKEAARVESMLQNRGWKCVAIHGDKNQNDRTRAVSLFKSAEIPLLIATDVAARGLDIPDVEFVINYSFPLTTEDYIHRIGRTGRAGNKGIAHTFFTQSDKGRAGEVVNVLKEANQVVPSELLKFGTTVKKKESKLYGAHFKEISADAPKATKIKFADSDDE